MSYDNDDKDGGGANPKGFDAQGAPGSKEVFSFGYGLGSFNQRIAINQLYAKYMDDEDHSDSNESLDKAVDWS